ncbi:MAG TPA: ribonuclease H-like domain-containing protein, partial [Terriglobia bacterium]|nr:ribonuclease H-like domain-containing protein [Terriglobia bacterium]
RLVVTYNGASFDIPLLESRFILARFENPLPGIPHLDLLTGARRLWRNGHGSCRLVALEREIVSFLRGPDIPGSMIPRVYFDFVNRASSSVYRQMQFVFSHNVDDIVSLAALTICACDRVTSEPAPFDNPQDLYSLARILENTSDWKRTRLLYEMALAGGLSEPACSRASESLSVIYRRSGEHERALVTCMELIQSPRFSIVAFEGAAIYHERIEGNPVRALEIVEEALTRLENDTEHKHRKAQLLARRERLRQKVIQF